MLGDHYGLQPGQPLPSVAFDVGSGRAHRFGKAPYLFQYGHRHLSDATITSCMRFLLHGMVFRTRDGNLVVLKSHLLRHAFATHAVQVEKIPVDIVGVWLHQKISRLRITTKPESMVAEASDLYLSRIATRSTSTKPSSAHPKNYCGSTKAREARPVLWPMLSAGSALATATVRPSSRVSAVPARFRTCQAPPD
jgi:hypothetical protein